MCSIDCILSQLGFKLTPRQNTYKINKKNALRLIDIYKLYIKINHCFIKFEPKMHPYMNLLKKNSSYYISFITVNFYNFSKNIYFNKI